MGTTSAGPHFQRITNDGPMPELSDFAPYRAVVVVEQVVSNDWRNIVSKMLCETGCRYMMAWGHDCSVWNDAVDWANLEQFDFGEVPEGSFVMTTWHDKEPLDEVFWFAQHLAQTDEIKLNNVILHISDEDKQQEFLTRYQAADAD